MREERQGIHQIAVFRNDSLRSLPALLACYRLARFPFSFSLLTQAKGGEEGEGQGHRQTHMKKSERGCCLRHIFTFTLAYSLSQPFKSSYLIFFLCSMVRMASRIIPIPLLYSQFSVTFSLIDANPFVFSWLAGLKERISQISSFSEWLNQLGGIVETKEQRREDKRRSNQLNAVRLFFV